MQLSESILLKEKSIFLRDYCLALYTSGATTMRIEKCMSRISKKWGTNADFSILPTCLVLTLWDQDRKESYNIIGKVGGENLNFATITRLGALSWRIVDEGLDVETARAEYESIVKMPSMNPWLIATLTSFANAAFCELFGGDWPSIAIVFVATFLGFVLKQRLPAEGVDFRLCIIASGCLSAIICCSGFVFGIGNTPEIALATSVLYLVPGIPFCNSVSDLIAGHYVCAMSRFIHAMIITVCLSLGLSMAFFILNLKFV